MDFYLEEISYVLRPFVYSALACRLSLGSLHFELSNISIKMTTLGITDWKVSFGQEGAAKFQLCPSRILEMMEHRGMDDERVMPSRLIMMVVVMDGDIGRVYRCNITMLSFIFISNA